ncbi:MAG: glycoside hydrolase family protein, partial [Mariprofundus sp.]
MAKNDWIKATDKKLIASIRKHEGEKKYILDNIGSAKLPIAGSCNVTACKRDNTWPAYICSAGHDTVGIGHLITGKEGFDCYAGISDKQAEKLLTEDLKTHLEAAKRLAAESGMTEIGGKYVVQRFMTELCFNIGSGSYRKFKNGLRKLTSAVNGEIDSKEGRIFTYTEAADEHLASKWKEDVGERAYTMTDTLKELDNSTGTSPSRKVTAARAPEKIIAAATSGKKVTAKSSGTGGSTNVTLKRSRTKSSEVAMMQAAL